MRLFLQYILILILLICPANAALAQDPQDEYVTEQEVDNDEISEEIIEGNDSCLADSIPLTWQERIRHDVSNILERTYTIKKTTTVRKKGRHRRTVRLRRPVITERKFTPSCCIYDLTTDSVLYQLSTDRMMIPASTQKLFITAAMLNQHGAYFSYDTTLYTHGEEATDSTGRRYLDGDIVVETCCNPILGNDDMTMMKDAVERLGFDSISGSIILREDARVLRRKTAETSIVQKLAKMLIADSIAFNSPPSAASGRESLPWKMETVAKDSLKRVARFSTRLLDVLPKVLKNSNNGYAESMLLNLIKDGDSWSYDGCRDIVTRLTDKIRRKYGDEGREDRAEKREDGSPYYNIADGSGLSHQNKTTAQAQIDLLRYFYDVPTYFKTLYEYLPIAGVDGTLSKRMKNGTAYDNVRAKTGTVNGVSTLSGYAKAANGHLLAFTILINNCSDAAFARSLQDKVCEAITAP